MEPVISDHARDRCLQRGITEEDIRSALRREIRRAPGTPGSIWVTGLTDGGRTLKVCLDTAVGDTVITAVWLS
jgi:hypothetical protein